MTTQQTSLEAFYGLTNEQKQCGIVYSCLKVQGEANIRMIAQRTGLGISSVCGRLDTLRKEGHVEESYKDRCPFTHKKTIFWRAK